LTDVDAVAEFSRRDTDPLRSPSHFLAAATAAAAGIATSTAQLKPVAD